MSVHVVRNGDVVNVFLRGFFNHSLLNSFSDALHPHMQAEKMVIFMGGLTGMDGTGLGLLAALRQNFGPEKHIILASPPKHIENYLTNHQLHRCFTLTTPF
ncbi:STAS domain-containing protein [Magnetococcus sp. PR-3]|uniref:STAS domain-containing protein n=1 Tax=Magnetococcus sp. PR-3 TaxID=3120355 RepID=UPI002FCE1CE3